MPKVLAWVAEYSKMTRSELPVPKPKPKWSTLIAKASMYRALRTRKDRSMAVFIALWPILVLCITRSIPIGARRNSIKSESMKKTMPKRDLVASKYRKQAPYARVAKKAKSLNARDVIAITDRIARRRSRRFFIWYTTRGRICTMAMQKSLVL